MTTIETGRATDLDRLCVDTIRMLAVDDVIDHHTFAIASDGDMQEGISSEAASLAGHLGLSRLVVFYDDNHWQRYPGDAGEVIGMSSFGASGPADELFRHFGFTPERVAAAAHATIARAER